MVKNRQRHTAACKFRIALEALAGSKTIGSVDISKNWTKRRLLQVACGKNPTAIRPVLVHEDRDLRHRR